MTLFQKLGVPLALGIWVSWNSVSFIVKLPRYSAISPSLLKVSVQAHVKSIIWVSTTSVLPIISDYNSDLLSFRNTRCFFARTTEMSLASLGRGCQNILFVRPGWCLKPKANSKGWNIEIESLLILSGRIGSAYRLHLEGGRHLRYTAASPHSPLTKPKW